MPCRSDYLESNKNEEESKRVAEHICYAFSVIGKTVPKYIKEASNDYHGNVKKLDQMTDKLCGFLRSLDDDDLNRVVYNARKKESRNLADWWERHLKWDEERIKEELEDKKEKDLLNEALNLPVRNLTEKHRSVLERFGHI